MSAAPTSHPPSARSLPVLETERLILRPFREGDVQAVYAYSSDPEVVKYMLWDRHQTTEDSAHFIQFTMEGGVFDGDQASWVWAMVLRGAADAPIGSIGLHLKSWRHATASAGYVIGRFHWGNGYTPEALRRIIQFGFAEIGLNRIEALHFLGNDASGRVMQKAGMQYEGILRDEHFAHGKYHDSKIYAILRRDWDGKTLLPPQPPEV